ncbi:MAG: HAMP domain-containing histidine kinase [Bacteroidales bacterium]|nr:HAMP domain-containing histidine kinase [Bacteroidales bacterium]
MKLFAKIDQSKANSIEDIKNLMLYRTFIIINILGIPILIYNFIFNLIFDFQIWGIIQAIVFIPLLITLIFYKKVSYRIKSNILIDTAMLLGLINFYLGGYAGAGIMIFLTVVNFSVLFLERRNAAIRIILCVILMSIIGVLFSTEVITMRIDINKGLKSGVSWSLAVFLFAFLSTLFAASYTIINSHLTKNIKQARKNEKKLFESNQKLQEQLIKNEEINKELSEALEKANESSRLKTEFLHNMSHEVRTPLNGIVGFSGLLRKDNIDEQKRKYFAEIIINSSLKLQKVIDDIVELSILNAKQHITNFEDINIIDFIDEIYSIFTFKMKPEVSLILKSENFPKKLVIKSDIHILTKIFGNIIENAIKFTEKGYIEIGLTENKNSVTIYVKDTGIGIPEDKKARIFERFAQADSEISDKYGGLGLGLSIAKENTKVLGGKISVDSTFGVGTCFFVEIPKG